MINYNAGTDRTSKVGNLRYFESQDTWYPPGVIANVVSLSLTRRLYKFTHDDCLSVSMPGFNICNIGPVGSNHGNLGPCPRPWRGVVTDPSNTDTCPIRGLRDPVTMPMEQGGGG